MLWFMPSASSIVTWQHSPPSTFPVVMTGMDSATRLIRSAYSGSVTRLSDFPPIMMIASIRMSNIFWIYSTSRSGLLNVPQIIGTYPRAMISFSQFSTMDE